ncbi:MAG: hypothetical protein P4L84_10385 [Isosphaeraceae bacterium]|nr:hypothetical protein [Isosphaeraceae bacterium]
MLAFVWPLLIYWLVLFVVCYTVTEVAQDQLYDEVTPRVGLKVGLASFILALLLAKLHPSFDTMFTTNIAWTVLQGIVWFGVFTLILQFHPWHALAIGLLTMLIVPGVATLGVDSILKPTPRVASTSSLEPRKPVRQSLVGPGATKGGAAPEKKAAAPAK